MRIIKEAEFLKIIQNIKGKTITIKLDGDIDAKITMEQVSCKISYKSKTIKLIDKAKKNELNINLSYFYKLTFNVKNNGFQLYCDTETDRLYTIEAE